MKTIALVFIGTCCLIAAARAEDAPDVPGSVAVSTVPARQGSLPRLVVAYGTAVAAPDAAVTLSLQLEGRIDGLRAIAGQVVRAGEALLEFAVSAGATSTYQQAVSALGVARAQRQHTRLLLGEQLATRDQVAQADKAVGDAQSALDALRQEGGGAGQRTLAAPFDGIVTSVAVAQGDRVSAGAPLLVVTRLDGVVLQVGLEAEARAQVRAGQPALLQPLDGGDAVRGEVRSVAGALDLKTHLLNATLSAARAPLFAGGAYRAEIDVGAWQGWIVPHNAVLSDAQGFYLFQREANTARRVAVRVLGSDAIDTADGADAVGGALDPRRPVIVDGAAQLADGGAVRDVTAGPAATAGEQH